MSATYIAADLRRFVRDRACRRWEYCHAPEGVGLFSHHIDHVIAEKHGGTTLADDLAMLCAPCNQHKGTAIASMNWETGMIVPLFNPRADRWDDHFLWDADGLIAPLTPVGRATAFVLRLNQFERRLERRAELDSYTQP